MCVQWGAYQRVVCGYFLCEYLTEVFGKLMCGLNSLPNTLAKLSPKLIPVLDISVRSARQINQNPIIREVLCDLNIDIQQIGKDIPGVGMLPARPQCPNDSPV